MRSAAYEDLSNEDVQKGRASIAVPPTNRPLHDYVPFYFGFKTPMVAWNQAHNEEIVYLAAPLDVLRLSGVVITDGNARSGATQFREFRSVQDLAILDVKTIKGVKYGQDRELKRRKQAEILIPDQLPVKWIQYAVSFSEAAQGKVVAILDKFDIKIPVHVNPGWFFGTGWKPRSGS